MARQAARAGLAALALVAVLAPPATGLEWGGIVPATSTMETVRARFGPPSRTTAQKVEGLDAQEWVYEGPRAPAGIRKLTVEFGLKLPNGFRPDLVRAFRLEPKPGAFTRATIIAGWGQPSFVHVQESRPDRFFYQAGLVVDFDKDGRTPLLMTFMPPQPTPVQPKP